MPKESEVKRKKAAAAEAKDEPKARLTITLKGRTLPVVAGADLTIDDQNAIRAATGTSWRTFYRALSDVATELDEGVVAVLWWVARRHAGERATYEMASADVDGLEGFALGADVDDEGDDSPEG